MRRLLLPLIATATLQAGMMDFQTLSQARKAYDSGDYAKAAALYDQVKDKNAQARYNYGDALYKVKKYEEASNAFKGIEDPALRQKALHNLGNSLALSGKTDEAIHAYEAALKLGEDEDTRYNLDLLKKQKEQKQRNQDQQHQKQNDRNPKDKQNNQNKNAQKQNEKNDQQSGGQQEQNKNSKQQTGQDDREKQPQHNERQQQSGNEQKKGQPEKQQNQSASEPTEKEKQQDASSREEKPQDQKGQKMAGNATTQPISDMEERKYNQMLDKRGIKTLMIPLSGKGAPHDDETTPW